MIYRIAVHRVWSSRWKEWRSMQVVEVDADTHLVQQIYPFTEELRNTEWWGGLMILSVITPLQPEGGEPLEVYAERIRQAEEEEKAECHAFYVTGFSIADRCFSPVSHIKLV